MAAFHFVLGLFWYSPALFGKMRNKELKLTAKDEQKILKKGYFKMLILEFIPSLVMAYVLAYFILITESNSFLQGAKIGFLAGLGFIATIALGGVFWEKSSLKGYLINISYYLLALFIMGGFLAIWPIS